MIRISHHTDLSALSPDAMALLNTAGLFTSPAWFHTVQAHAMPPQSAPLFLTATLNDQVVGLLALRRHGRTLESLTTPYSCAYAPVLRAGMTPHDRIVACTALAQACAAWPVLRLDAMDADAPTTADLIAGARATGLAVRRFNHFGNWHESVATLTWADYLAQRPGKLRNTVRRKTAALQRQAGSITILQGINDLEAGITAYEDVYARSWKQAEPFPRFNAAMMRNFAPLGQLRLGLMALDGRAIAAQIWLVAQGRATVVKLAHDEAFQAASPGTVLTAHMLRHLLDQERVQTIDFGRGDDPYKQGWASQRQQKIGLLLINPRRPAGLATLTRQMMGGALRRFYPRHKPVNAG